MLQQPSQSPPGVHPPGQNWSSSAQQPPPWQVGVSEGQTWPQKPQLLGLVCRSTQQVVPAQRVNWVGQGPQTPFWQKVGRIRPMRHYPEYRDFDIVEAICRDPLQRYGYLS